MLGRGRGFSGRFLFDPFYNGESRGGGRGELRRRRGGRWLGWEGRRRGGGEGGRLGKELGGLRANVFLLGEWGWQGVRRRRGEGELQRKKTSRAKKKNKDDEMQGKAARS